MTVGHTLDGPTDAVQADPTSLGPAPVAYSGMAHGPYGMQYGYPGGVGPYPPYNMPGMNSYWAYYRGLPSNGALDRSEPNASNVEGDKLAFEAQKTQEHDQEKDLKIERRKQANRESARRSKQRRKEESEALQRKAQLLLDEQDKLKAELETVKGQLEKLSRENTLLMTEVSSYEEPESKPTG